MRVFWELILMHHVIYKMVVTAGRMPDKSTGDLGADGYHKYKVSLHSKFALLVQYTKSNFFKKNAIS
jgi:hypothetical protein